MFLSSPPTASVGVTSTGRATGSGAYPRERPHRLRRTVDHPDHRVVTRHVDGPVMGEQRVGQLAQADLRLGVVDTDRLVREIPRGEHERRGGTASRRAPARRGGGATACTEA